MDEEIGRRPLSPGDFLRPLPSVFSAAQNSLIGLDFTETADRSDIFAGRLLPCRLPSKTSVAG